MVFKDDDMRVAIAHKPRIPAKYVSNRDQRDKGLCTLPRLVSRQVHSMVIQPFLMKGLVGIWGWQAEDQVFSPVPCRSV